MRVYLATGFPVINRKGREAEIRDKFGAKRLYSFADHDAPTGFRAKVTRSLEVYTGHIYSKRKGSEL